MHAEEQLEWQTKQLKNERDERERLLFEYKAMEVKMSEETIAKEEALTRLSENISRSISDNNPNIADLSDINRPTNLVERFSTLYDDEWTEAFETLQQVQGYEDEKKAIQLLLGILMDCFQVCRDMSEKQLASGLKMSGSNITITNLPAEMNKIVKDTRKKMADADLPMVHKMISNKFQDGRHNFLQSMQVEKYVKRCAEISWLMAIQDPPMAITVEIGEGFQFDKSKYREYTKTGKFVDYFVWPAVLIQDGGNVMSKGICQCRNR